MTDQQKHDYLADLNLLQRMWGPDFDWDQWYDAPDEGPTPADVFRRAYKWHDYRAGDRPVGTTECGGYLFRPTAPALYRLLHLARPSCVDFSDMYKTGSLVDMCSPDYQFLCSFQLWKHELGVYFECGAEHAVGLRKSARGGWPSCDNGVRCASELGLQWFAVAVAALEREWDVYSGNSFRV